MLYSTEEKRDFAEKASQMVVKLFNQQEELARDSKFDVTNEFGVAIGDICFHQDVRIPVKAHLREGGLNLQIDLVRTDKELTEAGVDISVVSIYNNDYGAHFTRAIILCWEKLQKEIKRQIKVEKKNKEIIKNFKVR